MLRAALRIAVPMVAVAAPAAQALEPAALFDKVSPSVWMVLTSDAGDRTIGVGSAVVIGPGRLVTNCHVLARAKAVFVRRKNVFYEGKLEHADPRRDLCVLSVENFTAPAVAIAPRESVKVGEKAFAIGNPAGFEGTLSEGLVSGLRGEWTDGSHVLQTTAPISPGSSGGGLFDDQGRLIGITTFQLKQAQNINFALPAEWIAEVPARAEAALAKRSEPKAAGVVAAAGPALPGYPASGTVWVYRMVERGLRKGSVQVTVRADSVDRDFVEETVALAGGGVPALHRTVSTHEASFLQFSLGGDAALTELAPYLLAPSQGGEPREALVPLAYPADGSSRSGGRRSSWVMTATPQDWQEVKVTAGTYRALHYEVTGKKMPPPTQGMDTVLTEFKLDVWYAPEVRRIVRLTHQVWTYNPVPYTDDEVELVEYRPPQ